jgi:uncharacterized membrane protein YqjE
MEDGSQAEAKPQATDIEEAAHPAREMSLHLLRMLETRMEAAGLVLQAEGQRLAGRLQLQMLAAAAVFIAIWGGIVLLAIALPPNLRVPVLAAVIAAFVLLAAWALLRARRMIAGREAGSVAWLLESLKLDLEVLARALAPAPASVAAPPPPDPQRSQNDLAA